MIDGEGWFCYPSKVVRNAAVSALAAIFAPVIPSAGGLLILFLMGLPAPDFDLGRLSIGFICAVGVGWLLLMVANVPRAYAYLQRFLILDQDIRRKVLGAESAIFWNTVSAVEKKIAPSFENYRWATETYLVIRSPRRVFTVYDKLDGFEPFKRAVSSICTRLAIPQYSIDRTPATLSRLRETDPALYRKLRRTGVRIAVDAL